MSFVNTLKQEDLNLLRGIVRKKHFEIIGKKHGQMFVSNFMIDQMIENIGPEVVESMIKDGVDKGLR